MRYLVVVAVLVMGCSVEGPALTSPTGVLIDPMDWWDEAEYRINHWLGSANQRCTSNTAGTSYTKPVIDGVFESDVETCTYSPGSRTIQVNPQYLDGCMAHELGHAALHQAGNPCWRDYEHDLGEAQ